jgi:hypothetical protein
MMRNIKVPLHHQAGDITIHCSGREYLSITFQDRKPLFSTAVLYYTSFFSFVVTLE